MTVGTYFGFFVRGQVSTRACIHWHGITDEASCVARQHVGDRQTQEQGKGEARAVTCYLLPVTCYLLPVVSVCGGRQVRPAPPSCQLRSDITSTCVWAFLCVQVSTYRLSLLSLSRRENDISRTWKPIHLWLCLYFLRYLFDWCNENKTKIWLSRRGRSLSVINNQQNIIGGFSLAMRINN